MRIRAAVTALVVATTTLLPTAALAAPPSTTEKIVQRAMRSAPAHSLEAARQPRATVKSHVSAGKKATFEIVPGMQTSVTPLDTSNSVSLARPDGVQVLTVLRKGHTARFKLDVPAGLAVQSNPDGGMDIVADGPEGDVTLAGIEAPWAVDAKGKRLPTTYTLRGTVLVQSVRTDGATYPITVDPYYERRWWGMSLRFTHRETRTMALGASGAAVVAGTLPPPWNVHLGTVAGAASLWANWALHYDNCIAVNVTWVGSWHPWYWNC